MCAFDRARCRLVVVFLLVATAYSTTAEPSPPTVAPLVDFNSSTEGTAINLQPVFAWDWSDPGTSFEYTHEASLQAAAASYGVYQGLQGIRESVNDATTPLTMDTADTAANELGLTTDRQSNTSPSSFETWLVEHLVAGHPVLVGAFVDRVNGRSDYDYPIVVSGFKRAESAGTVIQLRYLDLNRDAERTLDAPFFKTRLEAAGTQTQTQQYVYAIPSMQQEGLAITGISSSSSSDGVGGVRTALNHTQFREPRWPIGEAVGNISLTASIFGLSENRFYNLDRYDSPFTTTASKVGTTPMETGPGQTEVRLDGFSIVSNATLVLRVTERAAPPPTPVPTAAIAPSTVCPSATSSVYRMDDAATQACPPLGYCRAALCNCLGADDAPLCWLNSVAGCSKHQQCLAVGLHCIEIVARNTTGTDCRQLRDRYAAVAPPEIVPSYTTSDRLYQQSALWTSCQALACGVIVTNRLGLTCDVNYNIMCDVPNDAHVQLKVTTALPKVGATFASTAGAAAYDVGNLTAASCGAAGAAVETTPLALEEGSSTEFRWHLRLDNTTRNPGVEACLLQSASVQGSVWVTNIAQALGVDDTTQLQVELQAVTLPTPREVADTAETGCTSTCTLAVASVGFVFVAAALCGFAVYRQGVSGRAPDASPDLGSYVDRAKEVARKHQHRREAADESTDLFSHDTLQLRRDVEDERMIPRGPHEPVP